MLILATLAASRKVIMVGGCKMQGPGEDQQPAVGGAHGTVDGQQPFLNVYKDGFWHVNCIADELEVKGDKHGGNAQRYESGEAFGTSIVRYDTVVDSDKQESMTPGVCFNFCRTVPEMTFFGLFAGRDCYCANYYKATTGDGVCDRPCEGDAGVTCGGQSMSDMYQMHECVGGLAQDAADIADEAAEVSQKLTETANDALDSAGAMQSSGEALEGLAEGAANRYAQEAKVAAGPVQHAGEDLLELVNEFGRLEGESKGLDLTGDMDFETRSKAEKMMTEAKDLLDDSDQAYAAGEKWLEDISPGVDLVEEDGSTFVPVLRQMGDAAKAEFSSVCGGDVVSPPKVGLSVEECEAVCGQHAPKSSPDHCWAIQYFTMDGADSLCFLLSGLSELTSYNCGGEEGGKAAPKGGKMGLLARRVSFLEKKHHKHHSHHKHARPVLTPQHPSSKYILQSTRKHKKRQPGAGNDATCRVRFADVTGVTPEFKDGTAELNRCYGEA